MATFEQIYLKPFAIILWIFSMTLTKQVFTEDCPRILTREEWGSAFPLPTELLRTPVYKVFFHHTVFGSCTTREFCINHMRSMQEYFAKTLYFGDIGYNFVIGGDGNIYEGRGWDTVGAHTYGHNRDSISIAFMGDFSKKDPTRDMQTQAENLIECGVNEGYISSNYGLYGHRDGSCSLGPGEHFYNTLKHKWPHWHALGELERRCFYK